MSPASKPPRRKRAGPRDPLLLDVVTFIRRFVVMTDEQTLVVALWVIHTHLIDHLTQTPYLSITSPDSECGKSRLFETMEVLVRRPWMCVKPSEAVSYRKVQAITPTFLLDEVDTLFGADARFHEGLRAIIDAGHRRGAVVSKSANFGKSYEDFSPFCPKAFAGIGSLPDTIARRSIYVRLARKKRDEKVERFIRRDVEPTANPLRKRIEVWAKRHGKAVGDARPAMPDELSDRMVEGCEPLVAIAELMGQGAEARVALVTVLSGERLDSVETMRLRLLRDLQFVWDERENKREKAVRGISTVNLLAALTEIEESPWSNYYGKGEMQPSDLASLLRHYGVKPENLKQADGTVKKGYRRFDLYSTFDRYLR